MLAVKNAIFRLRSALYIETFGVWLQFSDVLSDVFRKE